MDDGRTPTIDEVDRALLQARAQDSPELDVALLWATRASILGVGFRAEHLVFVMGVTNDRAEELCSMLMEHGLIDVDEPEGG